MVLLCMAPAAWAQQPAAGAGADAVEAVLKQSIDAYTRDDVREAARLAATIKDAPDQTLRQRLVIAEILGLDAYRQDRFCAASEAWLSSAPQQKTGLTYLNLARLYQRHGDLLSARAHAQQAIAKGGLKNPQDAEQIIALSDRLDLAGPPTVLQDVLAGSNLRQIDPQQLIGYAEAFFAQLNGKTFLDDGNGTWSDDKLYLGYVDYQWCGPGRNMNFTGKTLGNSYTYRQSFRLDPATGTYRQVGAMLDTVIESVLVPASNNAAMLVSYEISKRGKRRQTAATLLELTPAGKLTGSTTVSGNTTTTSSSAIDSSRLPALTEAVRQAESRRVAQKDAARAERGGLLRSLIGAAVGGTMMAASGGGSEHVLGGALKGAQIFNQDNAAAASLGAAGDALLGTGSPAGATAGLAQSTPASYPTRPNLATGACAGFSEGNYRQKAVSGGGDQQLYTMCGQAFEYYTMYKRAIAQGYSEADANRTYAAHEQSARVAEGFLDSHGVD